MRLGYEVHLLCQDREPARSTGWTRRSWDGGGCGRASRPEGAGRLTVYTPDIGGLLPVYVADDYEGFEVKTFAELDDAELDRYLDANVAAVRDVVERSGASTRRSQTTW